MLCSLKGQPVTRLKEESTGIAEKRTLIWTFREMAGGWGEMKIV